jgi:hypothetical protein
MSDKREEILSREFGVNHPLFDSDNKSEKQQVLNAMDENGKRMCLELLEYLAENGYECSVVNKEPVFMRKLSAGWETLKKEQLFENFL